MCLNESFDESGPRAHTKACADPDNFLRVRGWSSFRPGWVQLQTRVGPTKFYLRSQSPLDPNMLRVESCGQNLGHFKHLYRFICEFIFIHFHNLDNH